MSDRMSMSMAEFEAMLSDTVTTVMCHPTQERRVRDLLVTSVVATPHAAYRVLTDESYAEDRVELIRPQKHLEWTP